MGFQALNKVFLFDKALKKTTLTRPQLFVLYTIYIVAPGRYQEIANKLAKINRATGANYLYRYLNQLIEKGFITRKGFIYEISADGIVALQNAEKRLRIERYDR